MSYIVQDDRYGWRCCECEDYGYGWQLCRHMSEQQREECRRAGERRALEDELERGRVA